jgi:hypothetical protein
VVPLAICDNNTPVSTGKNAQKEKCALLFLNGATTRFAGISSARRQRSSVHTTFTFPHSGQGKSSDVGALFAMR